MQTPTPRDVAIERALQRSLTREGARPAGPCPDASTLAAWADRTLSEPVAGLVDGHMSECARCQAVLAAMARMDTHETAAAAPAVAPWRRWRLQWMVPFAAAATAVAIWVASPDPANDRPSLIAPHAERAAVEAAPSLAEAPSPPAAPTVAPAPPPPSSLASAATEAAPARTEAANRLDSGVPPAPTAAAARTAGAAMADLKSLDVAAPPVPFVIVSPAGDVRWEVRDEGRTVARIAGATRESAALLPPAAITAGAAVSDTVCWLVGPSGAIRVATNGIRFASLPFPEASDLVSVRAEDARTAAVTTADGRVFRTSDGGATWRRDGP